jgi:hypothetical protein
LQVPGVPMLILVFFLSTFAFANFEPTLALMTKEKGLGLSDRYNFLVFAYIGLALALAQGLLYRRLAKRLRELTFMQIGSLLMALGLAIMGFVAYTAATAGLRGTALLIELLLVLPVAITGFAFMVPSVQALISRLCDPSRQGEILGINQSANAMARILGPYCGVQLYYSWSGRALPYIFGTCLLLIVFILTVRLNIKVQDTTAQSASDGVA